MPADADQQVTLISAYRDRDQAEQSSDAFPAKLQTPWGQHSDISQLTCMINRGLRSIPVQQAAAPTAGQKEGCAKESPDANGHTDHGQASSPDQASSDDLSGQEQGPGTTDASKKTASRKTEQNRRAQQRYRRRKKVG